MILQYLAIAIGSAAGTLLGFKLSDILYPYIKKTFIWKYL